MLPEKLASLVGDFMEVDWTPHMPRNIRFMRARVRVQINQPLLMGVMVTLDSGDFVWVTLRYERIYKFCRNCGRIGHTYAHCPWEDDEITEAIDEQMHRLEHAHGAEVGMSFARTHFVNEARRFYNNPGRRSIAINFMGNQYRPLSAPPIDFGFDPWGYIAANGTMQSLDPEIQEHLDHRELGEPSHIGEQSSPSSDNGEEPINIPPLNAINANLDQLVLDISTNVAVASEPEEAANNYQDPAMYPDESKDPEILAYTWNLFDRRAPTNHYFPIQLGTLSLSADLMDGQELNLQYFELDNGELAIANGRLMLDYDTSQDDQSIKLLTFPAELCDTQELINQQAMMVHRERGQSSNSHPDPPHNQAAWPFNTGTLPLEALNHDHSNVGEHTHAQPTQLVETGLIWNGSNYVPIDPTEGLFNHVHFDQIIIWSQQTQDLPRRSYWMLQPPQQITQDNMDWSAFDWEAEISRKRKFDNIEDLKEDICKKAKTNPLKIGLMGNLTKKRTYSAISDPQNTEDPSSGNQSHSIDEGPSPTKKT